MTHAAVSTNNGRPGYRNGSGDTRNKESSDKSEAKAEEKPSEKRGRDADNRSGFNSTLHCSYCKRRGHKTADCWSKPRATVNCVAQTRPRAPYHQKVRPSWERKLKQRGLDAHISKGQIALKNGEVRKVRILRDTGSEVTLVREGILPFNELTSTGRVVYIRGIGATKELPVSLHQVTITSQLVNGTVEVGVLRKTHSLPEGVDVILGNDVATSKITTKIVKVVTTEHPEPESFASADTVDVSQATKTASLSFTRCCTFASSVALVPSLTD